MNNLMVSFKYGGYRRKKVKEFSYFALCQEKQKAEQDGKAGVTALQTGPHGQ